MNNKSGFRISIGDDTDHEDLTAEIYFDEKYFALVSQEKGLENATIELQPEPDGNFWLFPLSDLLIVIEQAKQRLWELRRT
jgi:hypothetical protein